MRYLAIPVSFAQFWLFAGLALIFFGFLARALMRKPPESTGRREGRSRLGILMQSFGIAAAGLGPMRPTLAPTSAAAIVQSLVVVLLMSGAIALFAASSSALGKNWSFEARTRTDHQLIRNGPYAYVRHPIYLGMLLFLLGLAVALGHWLQLLVAIPLFLAGTSVRTRLEERLLEAEFGTEFAEYARTTPALVPRLR